MKWIRESMTQINLVEGEKKLAYIAYKNFRWLLYEGGEEWGIDLKILYHLQKQQWLESGDCIK